MSKKTYIDRPPRIQPELPFGEFAIPKPPDMDESATQPLLQLALPLITIFGYVMISVLGRGRSLLLIIPMGLSVIASTLMAFYSFRRNKKIKEEKRQAYAQRLVELRKEMDESHELQRHFYHYTYPTPQQALRISEDIALLPDQRLEDIRSGTRLWERRSSDDDFIRLRLGIGTLPSTVVYQLSADESYDSPQIRDAVRLAQDSKFVSNAPITIPIWSRAAALVAKNEENPNPPRFALSIVGNSREDTYAYVHSLLVDYAAFYSPNDTQLYIVGPNAAKEQWRWAHSLPHCKESNQSATLSFENSQENKDEKSSDHLRLFLRNLRSELEQRKVRLEDEEVRIDDIALPFILLVVDVMHDIPDWSALSDLESEPAISTILREGERLGAAVIFLMPSRTEVPSLTQSVIEVEKCAENEVVFRYAEVNVNSRRYVGKNQIITDAMKMRKFARQLEPLSVRSNYGVDLATSVTLFELLNITTIEDLRKFSEQSWQDSMVPQKADWLNVLIGFLSGNEPRRLVFSAKADGVHGMIAGSTGSGKSELLTTLIMGLAANYDPDIVNMVLVDYKGGSAFEPFRSLPHVVDIVTNLQGNATRRMFASIKAELDRRQQINTETDSKDIVHYRQKGMALNRKKTRYPHLFIIIDEFAEMIAGNAEFRSQLESITRLGRALGVTLILAAQRPMGVTDQMRANIKFRICLRVETPEDSRELLRRSDAAYLPPGIPGRGYLQVGNENIELIQTAYSGAEYRGSMENATPDIVWLDRESDSSSRKEYPKLYEVVTDMLSNLSREQSRPQWRPWPAFLPANLSLETPIDPNYISDHWLTQLHYGLESTVYEASEISDAAVSIDPIAENSTVKQNDNSIENPLANQDDDTQVRPRHNASPSRLEPSKKEKALPLNQLVTCWLEGDMTWQGIQWAKNALRPIVGLVDNPYEASQYPLQLNIQAGHAAIFATSGWGKTTFLRTMLVSLMTTHSPDELNIYILDLGGRNLLSFREFPHVGSVITSIEEERITRLLRRLNDIMQERQLLLSKAGVSDLYTYNHNNYEQALPPILVVIDNFAEFKENFEHLLAPLISIVRDSRAVGIHFVITADLPGTLGGKLYNLITERLTLKLTDASEYSNIVGRGSVDVDDIPGRGLVQVGRIPLEFQTALPFTCKDDQTLYQVEEVKKLEQLAAEMNETWNNNWQTTPPVDINTLAVRVSLEKLLEPLEKPTERQVRLPIGLDDRNLEPFFLDMQRNGPHMIVIGPPNSGKTTVLRTVALSLAQQYSPDTARMVLIDFQKRFFDYGGTYSLKNLPHVLEAYSKPEEMEGFYEQLAAECALYEDSTLPYKLFILIDNYPLFSEETYTHNTRYFSRLARLIREYQSAGIYILAAGDVSSMTTNEELRKVIFSSSFGLGLQTAQSVERLNGRMPRSLVNEELPIGRSFAVKSGRTSMLQVATPYSNDDDVEDSLDIWLQKLTETNAKNANWSIAPQGGSKPDEQLQIRKKNKGITLSADQIQFLKAELKKKDVPDELINSLVDPKDLLEYARSMEIELK